MIDTIIFDFDGTLADTNQLILNSFKHTYDHYKIEWNEAHVRSTFGEPLKIVMARDFPGHDSEEVLKKYREYQVHRFDSEVVLYPTVYSTLENLYTSGYKLGIATSRARESTDKALKSFGISHFFGAVTCAEDVANHKPHKEPLIKTMEKINGVCDNTIYVGDSKFDMECAINALIRPVLVGWHNNSLELSSIYRIDHILNKMEDLLHFLT